MSHNKITYEKEETVVDHITGEILKESKTKEIRIEKEPSFVKMYLDDLIRINDLPKSGSAILYELIKLINYDNLIVLNASIKKIIIEKLQIKMQSFDNSLSKFVKKNILIRQNTGLYLMNPDLFARGDWSNIKKIKNKFIELTIKYEDNKRRIKAELMEKNNE